MKSRDGWIGTSQALRYALSVVGCDRDGEAYCVDGSIVSSPDGAEVVVGSDAVYYVQREPKSLAGLMGGTSQGVSVRVY